MNVPQWQVLYAALLHWTQHIEGGLNRRQREALKVHQEYPVSPELLRALAIAKDLLRKIKPKLPHKPDPDPDDNQDADF